MTPCVISLQLPVYKSFKQLQINFYLKTINFKYWLVISCMGNNGCKICLKIVTLRLEANQSTSLKNRPIRF